MRLRIPEIGQHSVAHILGDKAVEPADHLGNRGMISTDHLAQIFGIQPRRQCCRADQIAEHHRQLPALSDGYDLVLSRALRAGLTLQCRDRLEQLAAVAPKHHAEILEILRRQLRQRFPIDLVVAEGRLIALKAQTL